MKLEWICDKLYARCVYNIYITLRRYHLLSVKGVCVCVCLFFLDLKTGICHLLVMIASVESSRSHLCLYTAPSFQNKSTYVYLLVLFSYKVYIFT